MSDQNNPEIAVVHWRIGEWFPDLSAELHQKLKSYHAELQKFNKTLSLISPKTMPVADVLHFADCILASRIISKSDTTINKIYDLGSGNGFPGLIYALLYPKVQVVLVDSDPKKCEFLKEIITQLSVSNASILNQSIESLPENSVRFAMARGLTTVSKAILTMRKQIEKGGSFFHFKGEEWSAEISQIPTQLCSIWAPSLTGEYKLPAGAVKFAVVRTEKIS